MKRPMNRVLAAAALAALLWLGWSLADFRGRGSARETEAVLWTSGAASAPAEPKVPHFALGTAAAPPEATRVPDVAYLRRALPALRRLEVRGDGLEPADLAATRGLRISWQRSGSQPVRAMLRGLRVPQVVARGERLEVRGTWAGLAPGEPVPVALESPDGAVATVTVTAGPDGTADFALRSAPAPAAGRFEWTLRAGTGGEPVTLGVSVREPVRPRILLLAESPSPEFARLQRWLADEGAPVVAQVRVSADRFRTVAANGAAAEFAATAADGWGAFDATVTTEAALAGLTEAARAALGAAVESGGMGLVVAGESAPGGAAPAFLPWIVPAPPADSGIRLARLRLAPDTALPEPVAVGETELPALAGARTLVADSGERLLAAVRPRGRGKIVRSVMADTWRWPLAGQGEAYGLVWRGLLAAAARPVSAERGSWEVPADEPVFAGEPVRLRWRGPADACPREVAVAGEGSAEPTILAVAAAADRREAAARFWPERAGWHRIGGSAGEGGFDLRVQPAGAWAEWRAERRREAMAARVAENPAASEPEPDPATAPWGPAAAFLVLAGWLWFRERKG